MLPISVLVPTRNSMSLLPGHIESMRAWLDLVEEVVAVDSHSGDGTPELLRRELEGPRFRLLDHPPGLYQSWNFGISQCRARFVYVSTVGDAITREGIQQLAAAAESSGADVVISPPRMVTVSGEPKRKLWPIHALIEQLGLNTPVALDGAGAQLFALTHLLRGILGSSASNLYRTEALQLRPFRTDFGTAGDLAWGLEHAGEVRWAIVPRAFSTFVFHPKSYAKDEYAVDSFHEKCLALGCESLRGGAWERQPGAKELAPQMSAVVEAWKSYLDARRAFTQASRGAVWWLRPGGWAPYRRRNRYQSLLAAVQKSAMQRLKNHLVAVPPRAAG